MKPNQILMGYAGQALTLALMMQLGYKLDAWTMLIIGILQMIVAAVVGWLETQ